nr:MAG TPA: hypothetical protein [Siphovirus LN-2020-2]
MIDHMVRAKNICVSLEPYFGTGTNDSGWILLDSGCAHFELWDYDSYCKFRYDRDFTLTPVRVYESLHFYWWYEEAEDMIHINRWPTQMITIEGEEHE